MKILFVCTGNTCRSSMAEGLFNHMLKGICRTDIKAESAGISAFEGDKANEKAILALKSKDIDISCHRARQLTYNMIIEADLILTMTEFHKEVILKNYPEALDKTYTLKEYTYIANNNKVNKHNLDIADPYGMDYNVYNQIMSEIEIELKKIINKLTKEKQ